MKPWIYNMQCTKFFLSTLSAWFSVGFLLSMTYYMLKLEAMVSKRVPAYMQADIKSLIRLWLCVTTKC